MQILGFLKRGFQYKTNPLVLAGDIVGMGPHLSFPAQLAITYTHKTPKLTLSLYSPHFSFLAQTSVQQDISCIFNNEHNFSLDPSPPSLLLNKPGTPDCELVRGC